VLSSTRGALYIATTRTLVVYILHINWRLSECVREREGERGRERERERERDKKKGKKR
jgi:hypothetical protein